MIELKTWLEELSLGKYAQAFLANEVDFDVLPDLTELDLEHLGVSLGDRKRLLRAITALSPSLLHAKSCGICRPRRLERLRAKGAKLR